MDLKTPVPVSSENQNEVSVPYQSRKQRSGPLQLWYRWTAPADPSVNATFRQKEIARRGRLASVILFLLTIVLIAVLPIAILSADPVLLGIILVGLLINGISLVLNRRGNVGSVGVLLVSFTSLELALGFVFTTGGLDVNDVPRFSLLVLTELLAVSLLPARSVFFIAVINSLFIWADLTFQTHTPALEKLLTISYYNLLLQQVTVQIVVAVITYLWVRSAIQAIARADRAEEVAALEHTIAQQKQELEEGIQRILQALVQAANGYFNVRVPLAEENVLWQVAYSLNTLLTRLQRSKNAEVEIQWTRREITRLVEALQANRAGQRVALPLPTGSRLDPLIQEVRIISTSLPPFSPGSSYPFYPKERM